jgi:hypothetical protein
MNAFSEVIFTASEILVKAVGHIAGISLGPLSIEFEQRSLDDRIARLDLAKKHLEDSLRAIEELQRTAKENKEQAEFALKRLAQLQQEKSKAEAELSEVRKLATADISTFQKLAGVPSRAQVKRERVVGFVLGVVSSIVASGLIYVGALVVKRIWP